MKPTLAWIKQPTTVGGISVLIYAGFEILSKQGSLITMFPLIAGALGAIIMPDNSGTSATIGSVVSSIIQSEKTTIIPPVGSATIVDTPKVP